jgi:predicted O-methyltransferase YrrM
MAIRFFSRPHGTGAHLNIFMFTPRNLVRHVKTLCSEPAYFMARLRVMTYQLLHPSAPWLTSKSIRMLERHLDKTMLGLEWGSGQSTIWLSQRLGSLVSVEHDASWYARISKELKRKSIDNVDYRLVRESGDRAYVSVIAAFPDDHFDVILVDGEHRDHCLEAAVAKIKRGGLIVLDNADQGYYAAALRDLEHRPTSNGVWRTDVFIKRGGHQKSPSTAAPQKTARA